MSQFGGGRMSPGATSAYSNYMMQRPHSQAAQNDGVSGGGTRPESSIGANAGDRTSSPDGPFEGLYKDIAAVNSGRHQATRSDTFGTPSRLDSRTDRRTQNSKADKTAMLDIFDVGFSRSVQSLGKGIMEEVREEMRQTLTMIRKDVTDTLGGLADTRDTAAGDMVAQVLDKVQELRGDHLAMREQLREQQQPLVEDLKKLHEDIGRGEVHRMEIQKELEKKLEDRFADSFERVSEEIREARKLQENETSAEFELLRLELQRARQESAALRELVGRQLERVAVEQEKMHTDNAQAAEDVHKFQAEGSQERAELMQYVKHQRLVAEVDFSPVLVQLETISKAVNVDMGTLEQVLGEIGKVQKALHVDFLTRKNADGPGTDSEESGLAVQEGIRVREWYCQTDSVEMVDADMVTDPMEPPAPPKGASVKPPKAISMLQSVEAKKKQKPKNVIDGDAMKQKMREALIKGEYNVSDFYHERGCFQRIARSWIFEQLTFCMIFLNGIWIAVDADHNDAVVLNEADPVFQVAENLFCAFFSIELFVRFMSFKVKRNCLKDFWFVFDCILVLLMVLETWIVTAILAATKAEGGSALGNLSILRMGRIVKLFRMARMARLLRSVPELVVLIKTIGVACRSVFFFFIFWLIIIFMFGIAFRQITKGSDIGRRYFDSVPDAMNTLLLDGLLSAQSAFVSELAEANPLLWPVMIFFILLASITIMNMLVGVLVEVVGVVAGTEKEKMSVLGVKHDLQDAMEYLGVDHTAPIHQDQFLKILMNPEMLTVMQGLGVDPFALVDATEYIFLDLEKEAETKGLKSSPGLTFEALIDLVLKMRGKNPATVKDVKEQTRVMKTMLTKLEEMVNLSRKQVSAEIKVLQHMQMEEGSIDYSQMQHFDESIGGGSRRGTLGESITPVSFQPSLGGSLQVGDQLSLVEPSSPR